MNSMKVNKKYFPLAFKILKLMTERCTIDLENKNEDRHLKIKICFTANSIVFI